MNYLKQIAKMLGVELGENFKLVYPANKNELEGTYSIDGDNFWRLDTDDNQQDRTFVMLLTGNYLLKKLPWKPQTGDIYFVPHIDSGEAYVSRICWRDSYVDKQRYSANMVCKTAGIAMAKG